MLMIHILTCIVSMVTAKIRSEPSVRGLIHGVRFESQRVATPLCPRVRWVGRTSSSSSKHFITPVLLCVSTCFRNIGTSYLWSQCSWTQMMLKLSSRSVMVLQLPMKFLPDAFFFFFEVAVFHHHHHHRHTSRLLKLT